MPRGSKYECFTESNPVIRRAKFSPYEEKAYVDVKCSFCSNIFEIAHASDAKRQGCLKHLRENPTCQAAFGHDVGEVPEKKRKATKQDIIQGGGLVTIYKLVFKPENRVVYTGKTCNTQKRLKQHASKTSGCRLIRNAIRRHGISQFSIEPIVKCQPADADANESYYIVANNTMYPNGYNLRHGSEAGEDSDEDVRVATSTRGIISLKNVTDQLRSQMDATADLIEICEDLEDCSAVDEVCRDLLRDVHPDRAGERSFSANEVAVMLNAVRESVRE